MSKFKSLYKNYKPNPSTSSSSLYSLSFPSHKPSPMKLHHHMQFPTSMTTTQQ
ncbi:hypothetical protein HanIR_Chr13g0637631 [Helianthus annuus]|nr:hypothetical protein HanIR_Chr13g0637631 [Helianthus annuus]